VSLKGQCHEIFDLRYFSSISFPQAPEYPIRLDFFENSPEIFAAQGEPLVSLKKSSIRKVFVVFYGHLWEVDIDKKLTFRCNQSDIVPKFATGINNTCGTSGLLHKRKKSELTSV